MKTDKNKSGIQRMTRQRRVLLEEICKPGRHLTADMILDLVRPKLPKISLATVYRNLETLVEQGLVRKLTMGGGQKHYDGGTHLHYHVRCVRCGKVADVEAEPFGDLNAKALEGSTGFEIFAHELEFEGICDDCRELDNPA